MKEKKFFITIFIIFLLIFSLSLFVFGDKKDKVTLKASIKKGVHYAFTEEYKGRIGEYEPLRNTIRPYLEGIFQGRKNDIGISGYMHFWDEDDQMYGVFLDYKRFLRGDFTYNKFTHHLDHDPLVNITGDLGKVIKDDFDPGTEYKIINTEIKGYTQLLFPAHPSLKLYLRFRREIRCGHKQGIAFSMCARCHVMGYGENVNQTTDDYEVGLSHMNKYFAFVYRFFYRIFKSHDSPPDANYIQSGKYDPAQYVPLLQGWSTHNQNVEIYPNNRLLYPLYTAYESNGVWMSSSTDGVLPFNKAPEVKKMRNSFKFRANLPSSSAIYTSGAYSTINNEDTDAEEKYASYDVRYFNHALDNISFSTFFRYEWIDNDDIGEIWRNTLKKYITPDKFQGDVPLGIQALGFSSLYDWYWNVATMNITNSELSRNVYTFGVNVNLWLPRFTVLKFSYKRENIERDNFEVKTTIKNKLRFFLNSRFFKGFRFRGELKYDYIVNPFTNLHAAGVTVIPSEYIGLPASYVWKVDPYLRTLNLTNCPNRVYESNVNISWRASSKLYLSLNADYKHRLNSDSGWNEVLVIPTFDLSYTPSSKFNISTSYGYQWMDYNTIFAVPADAEGTGLIKYGYGYVGRTENYDGLVHFIMINIDSPLTEKFRIYANTTINLSQASFTCDDLGNLENLGNEHFHEWLGDIDEYSKLNMEQYEISFLANYKFSKEWSFSSSVNYYKFNDIGRYLYDKSGEGWILSMGVTWKGF